MAIIVNNQNDPSPYDFANGPSELAVLENAQKAFGSLPGEAPFDVLNSISNANGNPASRPAKAIKTQDSATMSTGYRPSKHHPLGEAPASELLLNLARLKWIDKQRKNRAGSQSQARKQSPAEKEQIEQVDRLRKQGNYEQAIGALSDLPTDFEANEFLRLLLRLTRDLGATRNVIEHAAQQFGTKAPKIETAGQDAFPSMHKIGGAAKSIEGELPIKFAGSSKGQDALLESVFKWANTSHAPNDLANIVREQARQGSTVARILVAEAAFQRGKYTLAKKYFSLPDVQKLPITLVHRRLGELALMSGDAAVAASHFEVTLLIPNQAWQTATLPKEKTRQVGRLSDYYIVYWFDHRYIAVPLDRPFRGVTRLGGRAVQLFERKTAHNWDDVAIAYAAAARRKIWQRLFPEKGDDATVDVGQRISIGTRVAQKLVEIRNAIPGLSRIPARKISTRTVEIIKFLAKPVARLLPRRVIDTLLRLKPALEWRPTPRRYVTKAKLHAFRAARYLYRRVAAPVLVLLLNGRVIPESLCAENLTDLVNKLPPIPNTAGKAGN